MGRDKETPRKQATRTRPRVIGGRWRLIARLEGLASVAGCVVAVVGALILLGWAFRVDWLAISTRLAMNPVSALAFVLSGLALVCSNRRWRGGWARWATTGLAAGTALIGAAKLAEYALGWGIGVDRWMFPSKLGQVGAGPSLMTPNTALAFFFAGMAFLVRERETKRGHRPAQLLALTVGLIATAALVGYLYGVTSQYGVARFIPMARLTALAFVLLSAGLLLARPDEGLMAIVTSNSEAGVVARRLLPATLLIPLALGWLRLVGLRASLYETEFGVAMLVVATVVIFVALIWWTARLLHRAEAERRRADIMLRESEAFYHYLVESLPQNIFRKDREGRFTFGNQRFCETLGKPLESVLGRTDFDFFPRDLALKYRADDARVIETRTVFNTVEEHITPDGETHYVHTVKTPLEGPSGEVIGIQGIFIDVTEVRRTEQRLREQNERLQELAESERRALAEMKMAQSRMVETAKLAGLGQMVAGVAHEINNPLSYVSNNVAVLQRDLRELVDLLDIYREADGVLAQHDPERLARASELCERVDMQYTLRNLPGLLARTRDGLTRIQKIVKDLRLFARLDEGDLNEVDLNAGIESTITIIDGHARDKSVRIELDLAPLPLVTCYPAKINQVVTNLVVNAIDACDSDCIVLIRTRPEKDGVKIVVEDNGSGIEPAIRDRIFEPFFTTKPVGIGTGLGLSISYGIVQDHGGAIECEPAPIRGTRFTVSLPTQIPAKGRTDGSVPVGVVASATEETA